MNRIVIRVLLIERVQLPKCIPRLENRMWIPQGGRDFFKFSFYNPFEEYYLYSDYEVSLK